MKICKTLRYRNKKININAKKKIPESSLFLGESPMLDKSLAILQSKTITGEYPALEILLECQVIHHLNCYLFQLHKLQ